MLRRECLKKPEEEISSAMRPIATSTASSASIVLHLEPPQRHCSRSAGSSDTKNSDWHELRWSLQVRRYLLFVLRSPAQYWQCPRCRFSHLKNSALLEQWRCGCCKSGTLDALDAVEFALRLIAEPISSSGFFRYSLRNIFSLQPAAERTASPTTLGFFTVPTGPTIIINLKLDSE